MKKLKIREIPAFCCDMHKRSKLVKQMTSTLERQKELGKEGKDISGDEKKLFELYSLSFMAAAVEIRAIDAKYGI